MQACCFAKISVPRRLDDVGLSVQVDRTRLFCIEFFVRLRGIRTNFVNVNVLLGSRFGTRTASKHIEGNAENK